MFSVPFYGDDCPEQWINRSRYDNIAPVIQKYLAATKDSPNLTLLRDTARQVYRFALDRNDEDPKKIALLHHEFWGVKKWKDIDVWEYVDAGTTTAWYLMFGCRTSIGQTVNVLQSLGIHQRVASNAIRDAHRQIPQHLLN